MAASPLPEMDLARVARWCEVRVPEHALDQVRMEYGVRGRNVTLIERRVPWMPVTPDEEWTSRPVAQLRHGPDGWRLYWPDRNTRWHLIDDVPAALTVVTLLQALDDDRRGLLG